MSQKIPLRFRFILSFSILIIILMIFVIWIVEKRHTNLLIGEVRKRGIAIARNLSAVSVNSLVTYNYVAIKQGIEKVAVEEDIAYVIILDKEGKVAAFSGHSEKQGDVLTDGVSVKAMEAKETLVQETFVSKERVLDIAAPVFIKGYDTKWGLVRVGLSVEGMYREIFRVRIILTLIGLGTVIAGMIGSIILSRRITKPIEKLVDGAMAVAGGDMDYKIDIKTRDEIEGLANNFNYMTNQIRIHRLQLEEQLKAISSFKVYNDNILESMGDGLLTINLSGEIVTINKLGACLLGLDMSKEMLGLKYWEVFKGNNVFCEVISYGLQEIQKAPAGLDGGQKFEIRKSIGGKKIEELIFIKDNIHIPLSIYISAIFNGEGTVIGLLLIFHDLTEIKLMEEKVRRADRLAALGTIAATLAHDIKNPLTAIKTFVHLLPQKIANKDFQKRFNTTVPRELNRMNEIIENILDLARGPKLKHAKVDVGRLLKELVELYSPDMEGRGICISFSIVEENPFVSGDTEYLRRAFSNIIVNALQAMPRGGSLNIRINPHLDSSYKTEYAKDVRESILPYGAKFISISFQDTGNGMDSETVKHLFNPFYTTKEKGTGLGLAIAHKIIEEHKGRIDVISRPTEGTTFIISLPIID